MSFGGGRAVGVYQSARTKQGAPEIPDDNYQYIGQFVLLYLREYRPAGRAGRLSVVVCPEILRPGSQNPGIAVVTGIMILPAQALQRLFYLLFVVTGNAKARNLLPLSLNRPSALF
jgi:hypothetical protein